LKSNVEFFIPHLNAEFVDLDFASQWELKEINRSTRLFGMQIHLRLDRCSVEALGRLELPVREPDAAFVGVGTEGAFGTAGRRSAVGRKPQHISLRI